MPDTADPLDLPELSTALEAGRTAPARPEGAVILAHNHPAGSATPSRADRETTRYLDNALALMEIRLLDHFIVAGNEIVSMRERGGW